MRRPVGCDAKPLRSLIRVNSVHRMGTAMSQGVSANFSVDVFRTQQGCSSSNALVGLLLEPRP